MARLCTSQWGITFRQWTSLCSTKVQQINDLALVIQTLNFIFQVYSLRSHGNGTL